MDGVIFQSNSRKNLALTGLFPAKFRSEISDYNLQNGGVPRSVKIKHILHHIIKPDIPDVASLLAEYAQALRYLYQDCRLVPEIEAMLATHGSENWLATAAPKQEAEVILKERSLDKYFHHIGGFPDTKVATLTLAKTHTTTEVIFFGDARSDFKAAKQAGVKFVGVECERQGNFAGCEADCFIRDFSEWHRPSSG